ncbi:1780_t:CDS:2, partial [Ambispora leptoticha]
MAGPLPFGWEERADFVTGRKFYVDTKSGKTTWDDPRLNPQLAYSSPPISPGIGVAHSYFPEVQSQISPPILSTQAGPSYPWIPHTPASVSMPTPSISNIPEPIHAAYNPTRPALHHYNSMPMPATNTVASPRQNTMPLANYHAETTASIKPPDHQFYQNSSAAAPTAMNYSTQV